MKEALVRAAMASGRSLAQEIEYRLARSLAEDHGKSELEVRIDKAMVALREAVLVIVGYHGASADGTERRLVFDKQVLELLKASESGQKEEVAPPENRTALLSPAVRSR
jgi:hypothetical protein